MPAPEVIRSPQNARLKRVRALRRSRDPEWVLLEGVHLIEEALAVGIRPAFLLRADHGGRRAESLGSQSHSKSVGDDPARIRAKALELLAAERKIPCLPCEERLLREGCDLDSPPDWVAVAPRPVQDPDEVIQNLVATGGLALVAAGVQDPGNGGALVRVATGLGASAVVFLRGSVSPWHPRALRGASGTTFRLPVLDGLDSKQWLDLCHRHQLPCWGSAADGTALGALPRPPALGLLLGEEGRGLAPELRQACVHTVAIPLQRGVESLNVATAAAVLVHALA